MIILDHLTDAQKRAYIIADNQLALQAGWDEDLLRIELGALRDEDFDLGVIGFDDELARLLAAQDATDGLTDEDAVPELPETPTSAPGDFWILGNHKLLVGDSTKQTDVATLMADEAADLVFTDPPFNVDYEGYTEKRLKIQGDRMSDVDFKRFLEAAFRSCRATPMTNLQRRLQSLERPRYGPVPGHVRLVIRSVCGPPNLATSTCTRTLGSDGALTEVVHLDGGRDGLTSEVLERFIETFPIERGQK